MTTPLSDERLAEIRWHVMHEGPTDLGHVIGTALMAPELLAEVERLRSWLRECSVAMGGDGSDDSLLGLVYCCGAGNEALKQVGREQAEVDRLRAENAVLQRVLRNAITLIRGISRQTDQMAADLGHGLKEATNDDTE